MSTNFRMNHCPWAVVLDADFVIHILHEGEEFHEECAAFAERLIDADVTIVHTQLLRLEFLNGWRDAIIRRGIPHDLVALALGGRSIADPAAERDALYRLGDEYLSFFLSRFNRFDVRLSARLQDRARRLMARYNLKSLDACVVAAAFQTNVTSIASLDRRFRRVDDIHLWNDHIPARRQAARRR